jgi:hypothetical protein
MNDLQDNTELPRQFTDSVTRAIMTPESSEYVSWTEFLRGFPVAVRQRKILWDEWNRRQELQIRDASEIKTNT